MAQLKEGSIIRKSTGDEIIATLNDITGGGTVPTKTSELENDSGFITSSAIPKSLPANGGNADTVDGFTVGVSVPANAKFTDTIPDTSTLMPISGGDFTGISKAHPNTSYTVAQLRNVILSTGDAVVGSMSDGDIWIKYR